MDIALENNPVFPPEIFDLILEELARIQRPVGKFKLRMRDLQRCSLVCKAWLPIARSHLLHTVKVGDHYRRRSWYPPGATLAKLIIQQPHIASCLRRINYTIGSQGFGRYADRMKVLLYLPDIRSLNVQSSIENCFYDSTDAHCFGFRMLMDSYISSSTLTHLIIGNVNNIPIFAILSNPTLKSLSIAMSTLPDWPKPLTTTSRDLPFSSHLQHLELAHVRNAHYGMIVCLPHLRRVRVSGRFWDIEPNLPSQTDSRPLPFRRLESLSIDRVAAPWIPHLFPIGLDPTTRVLPCLRSLHVRPNDSLDGEEIAGLLSRTPNLEKLLLDVHAGEHLINVSNVYQYLLHNNANLNHLCISWSTSLHVSNLAVTILSQTLARILQPSSLQVLELNITMYKPYFGTMNDLLRRLRSLDSAIFKDPSNFPLIRDVSVYIFIQYWQHRRSEPVVTKAERESICDAIKAAFRCLNRAKRFVRLNVQATVRIEYDHNTDYDSDDEPPEALGILDDGDLVFQSDDEMDDEDGDEPWRGGRVRNP